MKRRRNLLIVLGAGAAIAMFSFFAQQGKVWRLGLLVLLGVSALVAPFSSLAQEARIYRVGVLSSLSAANATTVRAVVQGMEDLGWVQGKNISFEYRYADGDVERLPELAEDLVQRHVDIIVTTSGPGAVAAKKVTGTIPIVFANVIDPVGRGLVKSLARPGGNLTGIASLGSELNAKRVQLLKETIPTISRLAIVITDESADSLQLPEVNRAAKALNINILSVKVRSRIDLVQALASLRRWRADSLYVLDSSINFNNRMLLAQFAMENKLPMVAGPIQHTEVGGLLSYGTNYEDSSRRAATYVNKIFKGAKAGDLPIEQPTKFDFAVNLKTAKALGIKIPSLIVGRADKVIE